MRLLSLGLFFVSATAAATPVTTSVHGDANCHVDLATALTPAWRAEAPLHVTAKLSRRLNVIDAQVGWHIGDDVHTRRFTGATCEEIVDGLVVITRIMSRQAEAIVPPSKSLREYGLGLGLGVGRATEFSPHLRFHHRRRLGVPMEFALSFDNNGEQQERGGVFMTVASVGVGVCPDWSSRKWLFKGCGEIEIGLAHGSGNNVELPQSKTRLWLAGGARATLAYALGDRYWLTWSSAAHVPVIRSRFYVNPETTIHRAPVVTATTSLGIIWLYE